LIVGARSIIIEHFLSLTDHINAIRNALKTKEKSLSVEHAIFIREFTTFIACAFYETGMRVP